jgi:hypothetical protein
VPGVSDTGSGWDYRRCGGDQGGLVTENAEAFIDWE